MAWHESLRGPSGHRRPPLTGLKFLNGEAVNARQTAVSRSRFQARDLFSLLLRHFATRRAQPEPRCHIRLNALNPSGGHTVRIVTRRRVTAVAEQAPVVRLKRG
jgi:hypothetical protein